MASAENDPRLAQSGDKLRTPLSEFWRKFKKEPVAMAAGIFVLFLIVVAIAGPWLTPFDPENYFDYDRLNEGPSAVHWFGVDALGRDIFSRIVAGTRISLVCGFTSVFGGAVIGTALGLIAGFYEGWADRVIMRISDVLFAFPGILLAIGIVAILGGGMLNVVAAVAIFSIPAFARLVRANVLSLKTQTYVEAAKSLGISDGMLLVRHILPGTISVILVYLTMRIGTSIITAASLSFLGLGAQPPMPEWGAMLNEAKNVMISNPEQMIVPGIAVVVLVGAFNLLGDSLRDALDPKEVRL